MRFGILILAAALSVLVACGGEQQSDIKPSSSASVSPSVHTVVPSPVAVVIPASYVGRWSTHAAYLMINADGSGVAWAHWGPCTSSLSDQRMCALVATLTFVPARGGIDATVKTASVNLEDETPSGTPIPTIPVPAGFPLPGSTFFLSLSGDKLRQDASSFWPSMPSVWCDAAAATATGDCGA